MKREEIKVSVIVPVYNVEKYLGACIDSLLNQTLTGMEFIFVDDGAKDKSGEILDEYAAKDSRVVVIHQKNAGAGAARNCGVARAKGKYIGFVDSDDIVYPEMYESFYNKAETTQSDMVIMGEVDTTEGENILFPLKESPTTAKELSLGYFTAMEYPEILKNVFLWNRIYRLDFWNNNHFKIPEGRKFAEDLLICTQTSVLAKRIGYVEGPYYEYKNARENSLSDTLAKSHNKMDYILAVSETLSFLKDREDYIYFAKDILEFTMMLFQLLQYRIANYECFHDFYSGIGNVLEEKDMDMLKTTWLHQEFPQMIENLKDTSHRKLYFSNQMKKMLRIAQ